MALAFAIVPAKGKPELFIAPEKLEQAVRAHLEAVAKISAPEALAERLKALRKAGKRVRLDPGHARLLVRAARSAAPSASPADPIPRWR